MPADDDTRLRHFIGGLKKKKKYSRFIIPRYVSGPNEMCAHAIIFCVLCIHMYILELARSGLNVLARGALHPQEIQGGRRAYLHAINFFRRQYTSANSVCTVIILH